MPSASHPNKFSLLTVVTQREGFHIAVADLSVTAMPDYYEMTVLPLDEKKFCFLKEIPYSEEAYASILEEAQEYIIYSKNHGNFPNRTYPEITKEGTPNEKNLIVQDGHFAGVLLTCKRSEESYMHSTIHEQRYGLLFADGTHLGLCISEYSFNPGGRWHSSGYYLDKAEKWDEISRP